jgi:hypothetical protein
MGFRRFANQGRDRKTYRSPALDSQIGVDEMKGTGSPVGRLAFAYTHLHQNLELVLISPTNDRECRSSGRVGVRRQAAFSLAHGRRASVDQDPRQRCRLIRWADFDQN